MPGLEDSQCKSTEMRDEYCFQESQVMDHRVCGGRLRYERPQKLGRVQLTKKFKC